MKPSLLLKPYNNFVANILKSFENDKPLSSDQFNFLVQHEKLLSSYAFDPVIKYYLKAYREKPNQLSFKLAQSSLDSLGVKHIKRAIQTLLQHELSHVDLKMTPKEFARFKAVTIQDLIFWHGNQFLTGAPFVAGGIPHVIYMQWGNLFGVAKLQLLSEEQAVKGNILVYFEDMKERSLYECIKEYTHQQKITHHLEKNLQVTQTLDAHSLALMPHPVFHEIDDTKK